MRVLVAEDEKDLNRILKLKLNDEGFLVDSVFDGNEAVEYFDMSEYDVMLLDIMMPGKDGFEVLKHIRNSTRKLTPVIFLTARDAVSDRIKGLDSGANDYLVKPFEFAELLARLRALGRRSTQKIQQDIVDIGEKTFEVEHLSGADGKVNDVSIYARKGEIVGLAGLVGGGKTELCKTLFGAYKVSSGKITYNGTELKIKTPSDAVRNRIALVPEERRKEGVLVAETVNFNLAAASLNRFCKLSFVNEHAAAKNAKKFVEELTIATPSIRQKVAFLSGGNQQKVAVGKWLAADSDVYIFDEPTKGVDVGAKQEIFRLINQIAKEGNCVIYATCENSELLSITDRMYVMFDGRITAELETANTNETEIMRYSTGEVQEAFA